MKISDGKGFNATNKNMRRGEKKTRMGKRDRDTIHAIKGMITNNAGLRCCKPQEKWKIEDF